MTFDELEALIKQCHDQGLNDNCLSGSHVYILFDDGEVVMTKGGELLWRRNLHQSLPPCVPPFGPYETWPLHRDMPGASRRVGFAFVTFEDAKRIRQGMMGYNQKVFEAYNQLGG